MVSNKFDICKKMIGYFVQEKKPIILSLCAPFIVKFYQDKIIELGNEADIICGNMEEAVGFAGEKPKEIEKIFINLTENKTRKENEKVWLKENIASFKKSMDSIPFDENEVQQKIKKYEDFKKKIEIIMKDKNDLDFFSNICEVIINCYSRGNNTSER